MSLATRHSNRRHHHFPALNLSITTGKIRVEIGEADAVPVPPFTVFTSHQRTYFTYLLGYLTLTSSLTATIYLPLIESLSRQYNASIPAIDLTIALYLVFQAISPAFCGPFSDRLGRRPVFLITFAIYIAASLGLALNENSYTALLVLPSLQSVGGLAVISLAYAVVADISLPAERGKILGQTQWAFWTLVMFDASSLMLIGWNMPESGSKLVGNGEVVPRGVWNTWWSIIRRSRRQERQVDTKVFRNVYTGNSGKGVRSFPNPFSSPFKEAIGDDWVFTSIGLVDGVLGMLAVAALRTWGWNRRQARTGRD
ncbi:major facilitator superfamily domain-containing protein [Alternaria rosae]|uniref:major facilitator superfamily domain-containing protein n=1 Tax=Alternaria rosae TaxID=1187941 RepID=UPI001E8EF0A3|nr:major facilitator superfamily domain-containing protein [Alternaria rosae]KAH6868626.1 major facilitator superfamily domain-containing protein [Alternaria rosae]